MYFDTHAHYDFEQFDNDRNEILEKLESRNIIVINSGENIESCHKVLDYNNKYKNCYASLGIHPLEVEKGIDINQLEEVYNKRDSSKVVAIGETGLDYHCNIDKEIQKEYFIKHIELANKLNLPIVIHARDSHEDVYNILNKYKVNRKGIMHCYSGDKDMVKKFIELGFYISFGGPLTRYSAIQEVLKNVPVEKICVETDAPLLPPLPFEKNNRNDSTMLNYVIDKISEIKDISTNKVEKITINNAKKLFDI